jgi:hypothetical protein
MKREELSRDQAFADDMVKETGEIPQPSLRSFEWGSVMQIAAQWCRISAIVKLFAVLSPLLLTMTSVPSQKFV